MITIKQVEQIEAFVAEVKDLKKRKPNAETFYEEAKNLDKRVEASGIGYKSSINWNRAISRAVYGCGHTYSASQTDMNLDILYAALQGILNAQPYYDRLLEIRQIIYDIENADSRCKRDKVEQAIEEYNKIIEWEYENPIDDVELIAYEIICKLNRYIRRLPDEFDKEKLENIPSSAINVVQTNSQVSSQTLSFSIEQSIQELDGCEKIDSAELEYIKKQLNELQQLLESKKRGNKVREKVSAILKWLADKTTDVMIAVLPALITGLKG
jgi:tetratricopeptide (TPR) repeat protein